MSFQVKYIYDLVDQISPKLQAIKANVDQMSAKVQQATKRVDGSFEESAKKSNALLGTVKRLAAAYITLEGAKRAITTIADFDKSISSVKAVTNATAEQIVILRNQAIDLGAKTQFSARQAAEAMVELGKAGLDTSKIYESMPAVLDLAAAGGLGLAEAASISANIMAGFQIPAKEMVRVADTLSFAANAAQTSVQEIGLAVSYVGQAAKQANIPLEQVSAAIGMLSNFGISGERAGTGLRRVLSELANPTKQAAEELAKYGIQYKDINPQTNKFSEILKRLQPIAKNMNSSFKVFGDIGAGVFQVLSNNVGALDEMTLSLNNAQGSAAATAKTMRDNLGGDIDNLSSAIEGLVLRTGDGGLTGVLRGATQWLTNFFGALSGDTEAFNNLGTIAQLFISVADAAGLAFQAVSKLISFFTGGESTTFGKFLSGFARDLKTVVGFGREKLIGEQNINNPNSINQNMSLQNNVAVEVGFKNAPSGTTASVTQPKPTNLNLGSMGQFAGAY